MNYKSYYDQFNENYNYILEYIKQLQEKLDLSIEMISTLKIKKDIGKLDNKFIEFFGNTGTNVKQVISSIDEFKDNHDVINDVNEKLENLKDNIKDIKIRYIKKYNVIVENTNKKINELKRIKDVNSEIAMKIQKIKELPNYVIQKNFAFNNKLGSLKNSKVINTINEIESINSLINTRIDISNDIFTLNDRIDKLENAINNLYNEIENKEIIIDKENRKKIDLIIDRCEKELELCEKTLLLHKKDKVDDYSTVELRIDKVQDRLTDTSIMYRSKCPLLVKRIKSAKEVYKKNDKLPLIALGISSLSLIDFVVGPVIIPGVMCGNMKLANRYPKFNKVIKGVNKVLARVIDAKEYENGYKLRTGVELNEDVASVSVLKSIAIHEGRELIVPLIYNAKSLFEKMRLAQLKENIAKGVNNTSNKIQTGAKNIKESVADNIKIKDTLTEISKMFKEFQQSKLSMDEFCKHNSISADDRIMLETFNRRVMG